MVADAIPGQSPDREKSEWRAVVDAVVALALTCSSLEELEAKIAEQSRSLRNPPEHAVVLSTIHSAKGLEWDTVVLVGMEDGVLPLTPGKVEAPVSPVGAFPWNPDRGRLSAYQLQGMCFAEASMKSGEPICTCAGGGAGRYYRPTLGRSGYGENQLT